MKKLFAFLFSLLIGIVIFGLVIEWVQWKEIKEVLTTFFSFKGLVISVISLLIYLVGVWKWKFILKSQGYNIPFRILGEVFLASFSITYLFTPTAVLGGEWFRAYALKKKFPLPWEKNLAALAVEKLLGATVLLLFLVAGILSFFFLVGAPLKRVGVITAICIGGLTLGLTIFYFKSFKKESIFKLILRIFGVKNNKNGGLIHTTEQEIFHFFDFKKSVMWKGLGISMIRYFLILIRAWLIIFFLRGQTSLLVSMVVVLFIYLAYLCPVPAGLGSLEVAQSFAFNSMGLGLVTGISFSFILRGAEILVALIGCFFLGKLSIEILITNIKNFINKFSKLKS